MTDALNLFRHIYVDNRADKTLFLLHGTGGNESDLLSLVEPQKDNYNFVGLRGNVTEQGMPRFFKRITIGVFDQDSIKIETNKVAEFVTGWRDEYKLSEKQIAFLGYSNGANMILATTFLYPEVVTTAVLLHPMLPIEVHDVDLTSKRFLVTYGENDQMISATESQKVVDVLEAAGATLTQVKHSGGHEVRREELEALIQFLS